MRGAVLALLGLALGLLACRKEPTFDERYDTAQKKIEEMSAGIDRDLDPDGSATLPARSVTDVASTGDDENDGS